MSDSLTLAELREALASLATKDDLRDLATKADLQNFPTKEELRAELNDRFNQWDAKHDQAQDQLRQDFAEIIERVNDYTTAELGKLRHDLEVHQKVDQLAAAVAQRFGVSVAELMGGRPHLTS